MTNSEHRPWPDWVRPPDGTIPGCSCQRATLVRTDEVVFVLDGFLVYPSGVEFRILGAIRHDPAVRPLREMPRWSHSHPAELLTHGGPSEDFVRLSIEFGDGTVWTNVGWAPVFGKKVPADRTVVGLGGHGSDRRFEHRWWMWPLPPPGQITFACSWPARDIHDARAVIDGDELRAQAADAEVLWN